MVDEVPSGWARSLSCRPSWSHVKGSMGWPTINSQSML